MAKFSVEFQEELYLFLSTEEGFNKFGLLLPNNVFTVEYLDIAWVEELKFFHTYRKLPTKSELFEIITNSDIVEKMKPLILEKLRSVYETDNKINTTFVEEKIIAYIKEVKADEAIQQFLDLRDDEGSFELFPLVQKLNDINSFMLPVADNYFETLRGRLSKYRESQDRELVDIGLGAISIAKGELGIALAPPKRGKSLFLVSAGYGALISGSKVLHITLELRKPSVELRYDRAISGLTKGKLNRLMDGSQVENLFDRIRRLGGGVDIYDFQAGKTSVDMLYGLINREFKRGNPYDLLIVDYADLLAPSRYYKDRRFELSLIYTELRSLASEFKVACWTASQTRRETLNQATITMEDVAEDIGKVAICDMAVALCQTGAERANLPETGRLFMAGAREALDGVTIPCVFDRDISRILVRG